MSIASSGSSRLFRVLSCIFSLLLLYSNAAAGVNFVLTASLDKINQFLRQPHGAYTDVPGPVFLGKHPRRDPLQRGGKWNARTLADLTQVAIARRLKWQADGLFAAVGEFAFAQLGAGGEGGSGGSG